MTIHTNTTPYHEAFTTVTTSEQADIATIRALLLRTAALNLGESLTPDDDGVTIPLKAADLSVYLKLVDTLGGLPNVGEEAREEAKRLAALENSNATSLRDVLANKQRHSRQKLPQK
jgi:hypothetical protein